MDYSSQLSVSYYKVIATINSSHKIYLVQHIETGKIYVKKILDVYNISVYSKLKNAHILGMPKIIDYCEEENSLILIEEYIPGNTLSVLMQNQSLSIKDIRYYLLFLCDILGELHRMNPPIIHRDIKPANIIIDRYNRPVLIDYNAAKIYNQHSASDTILLGTQGYAAPEQYGFGASSPQTDIYSLGILLKELVQSLKTPTASFDSIMECCTQLNPSDRYSSIAELQQAILAMDKTGNTQKANHSFKSLIPPGYRTSTPWKMLLASLGYLFIFWLSFSLKVKNASGIALWLNRSFCLAMLLALVVGCFNYRNIHQYFPLCCHTNRILRYTGIALLNAALVLSFFIVLIMIETVCFHL